MDLLQLVELESYLRSDGEGEYEGEVLIYFRGISICQNSVIFDCIVLFIIQISISIFNLNCILLQKRERCIPFSFS